jgi:hypothetical protein
MTNLENVHKYRKLLICVCLASAITIVYWQLQYHSFINYDDDVYVTQNRYVQSGLCRESILWAFTATDAGFWHPLTWLSLMFDYELFRLNPAGYHWTNVLFHIGNTLLLFLVLNRMTGAIWRSGFAAALFAVHPLHVESVAWIAERKDVLSTLFWMLTMYAYAIYVERPSVEKYVLAFISFSVGLMAKPMLVTLPFVLLLLDYWPLKRLQSPLHLVLEKVPFFIVTILACVATFITEQESGALSPAEIYPLDVRMQNAIISYVAYIKKTIWPSNLAILYPYPVTLWPIEQVVVSGLVLVIISIIVVRWIYTYPYLAIGWFWYLGTLVPVIGFVQVGIPAMADRYTYVPLVGLFITITWGFPDLMRRWKHQKTLFSVTSVFVLVALMTCSWFQVLHWKNSISLFEHELKVTEGNFIAHNNLGIALKEQGRLDEAISHFHSSIQMKPTWQGYVNLGLTLTLQGRDDEAISVYEMVLRKEPNNADVHYILGNALVRRGKVDEAIAHFHRALQYRPDYSNAHYNLALALKKKGMNDKAAFHFREAAHLKPAYKFSLP